MDGANNTGEIVSGVAASGLPIVEMPKDFFQQDKHGHPIFQIATTEGDVQVVAWPHNFYCRGTSGALVAYGLLQADWMPGIPGNNSVRQAIAFDAGRAIPLRGLRRGSRTPDASIIIMRRSRVSYEVRVPTTKAQQEFIDGIKERHDRQERKAKEKEVAAAYAYKPESSGKFRDDWLMMVDMSMSVNYGRMEACEFSFSKESADRINRAFSELRSAIAEGGVQAAPTLHRVGNVIYLGAAATEGVTRHG